MTEPDVTLTDYAVALECLFFVVLLLRGRGPANGGLRTWFMLFFGSVAAASIAGGTVHGFFVDEVGPGFTILWSATLLAMGVTGLSMWAIGGKLLFATRVQRWIEAAAAAQLAVYGFVVLFRRQEFWVGIVANLPALLFLLVALGVASRREKRSHLLLAVLGLALVVVAAILQQLRIGIDPRFFNHNALYHVLQAFALALFFKGCWPLIDVRGESIENTAR